MAVLMPVATHFTRRRLARWTPAEDAILAVRLGRTVHAAGERISKLGDQARGDAAVRTYKRVDRARRGRMFRAVELRGQGLSLRQIAARLEVTHPTVMADLARWEEERKVVSLRGRKVAPRGEKSTIPPYHPEAADVVEFRRAQ